MLYAKQNLISCQDIYCKNFVSVILGIGLQIENDDKNESNQIFRLQENSNYLKNPKSCKICSF